MPIKTNKKLNDPVSHPSHYTDGKIEVIEYIEDKKLGFHLGNAVKYISRAGKKDPNKYIEDLRKAIWYINREIERELKSREESYAKDSITILEDNKSSDSYKPCITLPMSDTDIRAVSAVNTGEENE